MKSASGLLSSWLLLGTPKSWRRSWGFRPGWGAFSSATGLW